MQEMSKFLRAAQIDEATLEYLKREDVKGSLFLSLTPDYLRDAPNAISVAKLVDIIHAVTADVNRAPGETDFFTYRSTRRKLVTLGLPFLLGNPRIGLLLIPWVAPETQSQFFIYNPGMSYESNSVCWWLRWLLAPQLLVWDYIQVRYALCGVGTDAG
jgi:hypothetical protein